MDEEVEREVELGVVFPGDGSLWDMGRLISLKNRRMTSSWY